MQKHITNDFNCCQNIVELDSKILLVNLPNIAFRLFFLAQVSQYICNFYIYVFL